MKYEMKELTRNKCWQAIDLIYFLLPRHLKNDDINYILKYPVSWYRGVFG